MRKLGIGVLGAALVLSTAAAARWVGGWAVVTVENVPEYLVVGKPQVLEFWVRQHGVTPMADLKPSIVARSGSRVVRSQAWATPTTGVYRASVTVPSAADWELTIESGFGASKGHLLPLKAVNAAERVSALSVADRGRQLFAAKGCVGCHVHRAVDLEGQLQNVGPDLSDRRFAADYLAKFLADPSIKPESPNTMRMPNLALRQPEIASLVAFINSERRLSNR
jgi:mono/diheme cytochrome c family protein